MKGKRILISAGMLAVVAVTMLTRSQLQEKQDIHLRDLEGSKGLDNQYRNRHRHPRGHHFGGRGNTGLGDR